jgi:hypothetical protein
MRLLTVIFFILFCIHFSIPGFSQCNPPYKIEWPAQNPVWEICWLPPDQSTGMDGSGIEFRYVKYKGKLVLWRMNMPLINVIYDPIPNTCGPTFRDWLYSLATMEVDNIIQPGYAEPTFDPITMCDNPGTVDVGTFEGVAVQKLDNQLIVTTHMFAGWYRYIEKFIFFKNGDIEPQFGFTAQDDYCIDKPHVHHAYWRFDFDIEGAANDAVRQLQSGIPVPFIFSTETKRLRAPSVNRRWRVFDKVTGRAVLLTPNPDDPVGGDAFGGYDLWALRYHSKEIDDGGGTPYESPEQAHAQHLDNYLSNESINGQDVVLWYRISHYHNAGPQCMLHGPKISLVGNW